MKSSNNLYVSIPDTLSDAEWSRMKELFDSKLTLERHAFGSDSLDLVRSGDRITLCNIPATDGEISKAAIDYLVKLEKLAKELTRVNRTAPSAQNERYAFRGWLLRLGFVGPEYKESRQVLLKNLHGSPSYRDKSRKSEN